MKKIPVAELQPAGHLSEPLYHESGAVLFSEGATVGEDEIGLLKLYGIKKVYALKPGDGFGAPNGLDFQTLSLRELDEDLPGPLYAPGGAMVIEPHRSLTPDDRERLLSEGIERLYALKPPSETPEQVRNFKKACEDFACFRRLEGIFRSRLRDRLMLNDPGVDLSAENMERHLREVRERDEPRGLPLKDRLSEAGLAQPRIEREPGDAQALFELYQNLQMVLQEVFDELAAGKRVRGEAMEELSRQLVIAFLRDRNLLLNMVNLKSPEEPLAEHALHVATLCVGMALEMGYNQEQVRELAWAALLHDVGSLREADGEDPQPGEPPVTRTLDLLRLFDMVPQAAAVVAWQARERPDGSGRPNQLSGDEISFYARILSVADAYDTGDAGATAAGADGSAAKPHDALRALVQASARRIFDPKATRGLLRCLSLYPIGTWVELDDGRRGKVIGVNGSELARPLVRVLEAADGRLEEPVTLNLLECDEPRILRPIEVPLDQEELFRGF